MSPTSLSGLQQAIAGGHRAVLRTGDLHRCTDARDPSTIGQVQTRRAQVHIRKGSRHARWVRTTKRHALTLRATGMRTERAKGKSGRGPGRVEKVFVFAIKRYHFAPAGKELLNRPKTLSNMRLRMADEPVLRDGAHRGDFRPWPGGRGRSAGTYFAASFGFRSGPAARASTRARSFP